MKNKKKYVITLVYTEQKDVEVEAESLEEAKNIAVKVSGDKIRTGYCEINAICKSFLPKV